MTTQTQDRDGLFDQLTDACRQADMFDNDEQAVFFRNMFAALVTVDVPVVERLMAAYNGREEDALLPLHALSNVWGEASGHHGQQFTVAKGRLTLVAKVGKYERSARKFSNEITYMFSVATRGQAGGYLADGGDQFMGHADKQSRYIDPRLALESVVTVLRNRIDYLIARMPVGTEIIPFVFGVYGGVLQKKNNEFLRDMVRREKALRDFLALRAAPGPGNKLAYGLWCLAHIRDWRRFTVADRERQNHNDAW